MRNAYVSRDGAEDFEAPPLRCAFLVPAHTFEISCGVTGGVIVVVMVITLTLYRNWKYEQELDSLLWKVDFRDIQINDETNGMHGGKSRVIDGAASLQMSSLTEPKHRMPPRANAITQLNRRSFFTAQSFMIFDRHKQRVPYCPDFKKTGGCIAPARLRSSANNIRFLYK